MAEEVGLAIADVISMAGEGAASALSMVKWSGDIQAPSGIGWNSYVKRFYYDGVNYTGEFYLQNIGSIPIAFKLAQVVEGKDTLLYSGTLNGYTQSDPIEFTFSAKGDNFKVMALLGGIIPAVWPFISSPNFVPSSSVLVDAKDAYYAALVNHNMVLCQAAAQRFRDELSAYKSLLTQWNGKTGNTEDLYNQIVMSVDNLKAISQDVKKYYDIAAELDRKMHKSAVPLPLTMRINNVLSLMGITVPGFISSKAELNTDKLPDRTAYAAEQKATADDLNGVVEDIKAVLRDIDIKAKSLKLVKEENYAAEVAKLNDWKINTRNKLIDLLSKYRSYKASLTDANITIDTSTGKAVTATIVPQTTTSTAKAKAIATTIVNKAVVAIVEKTPEEEKVAPTPEELRKLTQGRPGVGVVY